MSWDLLILHPEPVPAPPEGSPQLTPLGMAQEIRRALSRSLPGLDWPEPLAGVYQGRGYSLEIELPSQGVVDSVALHVRGPGNPLPAVVRICRRNGWVAFDSVAGSFLDLDAASSEDWRRRLPGREMVQSLALLHRVRSGPGGAARPRRGRRALLWLVPLLLALLGLAAWMAWG